MSKIVRADLDEIVEAVVNDQDKFIEYMFSSAFIDKDRLRTTLERFVVDEDKGNPIGFAEWILHEGFEKYTDNDKCWWGRFNEEKDYSTEQLYDMYILTTPKKGGDDEA